MRTRARAWMAVAIGMSALMGMGPVTVATVESPGVEPVPDSAAASKLVGFDIRVSGIGATTDDTAPSVAYNPTANQYLVVWEDERNLAVRGTDIFGRRVRANGTQVGGDFRISGASGLSNEHMPAVAYNPSTNQFLVVWEDERDEDSRGVDVFGRRLAADGSRLGGEFRISGGGATTDDTAPAVAYNSTANQYLVAWADRRDGGTLGTDIYGRRVAANGKRVGSDFRITGGTAHSDEYSPAVAYNSTANQYLVVWKDFRNWEARQTDIFGQRVRANGTRAGSDFQISGAGGIAYQQYPAVAYNSTANQYLVVWEDYRNEGNRGVDVYGRRVAANGKRVGIDIRISGVGAIEYDSSPAVAYNSTANQYLVVWKDARTDVNTGTDVYGRRVAANGGRAAGDFRISRLAGTHYEHSPAVAHNPAGNQFLVVWEDWRNTNTRELDIYGRRVAG